MTALVIRGTRRSGGTVCFHWRGNSRECRLQAPKVAELKRQLLREARPDAISLVDAWAFTDYELNSCIGREDGDVYDALLRAAQASPLNATDEGPAWEAVLKPMVGQLRAKL